MLAMKRFHVLLVANANYDYIPSKSLIFEEKSKNSIKKM